MYAIDDELCRSEVAKRDGILQDLPTTTTTIPTTTTASTTTVRTTPKTHIATTTLFRKSIISGSSTKGVTDSAVENGGVSDERKALDKPEMSSTESSTKPLNTTSSHVESDITHHDYLLIFLPIICGLCVVICGLAVCRLCSQRNKQTPDDERKSIWMKFAEWLRGSKKLPVMQPNILYVEKDLARNGQVDPYEISYERLRFGNVLGQGAFGLVYSGTAMDIAGVDGQCIVAIKQLKVDATESEKCEFIEEIGMLRRIGQHPNIVSMMGYCTSTDPYCIVMEYAALGDLHHYLQQLRSMYRQSQQERALPMTFSSPQDQCRCGSCSSADDIPFVDETPDDFILDPSELQSFAVQVCRAMCHLESIGITHRDLATRNILVSNGKVLKLSDFGLSRVGVYVKTTSGRIPLRWLSTEAMRDHVYTIKSDVWAYGVVLWEICTLGAFPYPSVSDNNLLDFLEQGYRLQKPSTCNDALYHLMLKCWSLLPQDRPSFSAIASILSSLCHQPYVDFAPEDDLPPDAYCRIVIT